MKNFLKHSWHFCVLCIMVTCFTNSAFSANYTVSSADQFNSLSLFAGDIVIWTDGTYSIDDNISFSGNGTSSNPITLKAETPGGVVFTGEMSMDISGDYVIVDGFYWKEGGSLNNHVEFRNGSTYANNSIIRNCAFNNLTPSGTDKHRWIVFYGKNNVVENCSFLNKNSPGALLLVELEYNDFNPVGHHIRNNYFYNYVKRDPTETHSGDSETIRVGTSEFQDKSASTTVEGNYFYKADGENEIITNKSADNNYFNNTFRKCRGSLVMRHGARATVQGNYFLGENEEGTGGIRITDSYHVITNNYFQDLISTGDKWNNGITLVGGSDTSGGITNGYQKVDDIVVAYNTLYNVESPIFYNDRSSYDPTGVLDNNVIYTTLSDVVGGDISGTGQGMTYDGNIFSGSALGISNDGFTESDPQFFPNGEIFQVSNSGPAARKGSAIYSPHTDNMVGTIVGACFLDASGSSLSECGGMVPDFLNVSSISDFTSSGGNETTSISANVSWSASDNQSWITISPISGSGNGNITITTTTNSSTSSRTGTVTVTGSGVSAKTISVTQAGFTAPIAVTGVSISPVSATVGLGESQQLSESVSPSNASNQSVSYSSNNTSVATVNLNGVVTAVSQGSVTITVTTDDGGHTDTAAITVTAPSIGVNLALNKTISSTGAADGTNVAANLVDGNVSSRWSVSGFPQTATIDLGATFSLASTEVVCYSDRDYQYTVSVSSTENGTYTQVVDRSENTTPGTETSPIIDNFSEVDGRWVQVTVTGAGSYTGSWVSLLEFRIFAGEGSENVPVTGVSLTPSSTSLTVGGSQQLSASVSPSNATNQSVSYSSSNTSVASVSSNGLVTAQGSGLATITVTTTDGGFTDTSSITVTSTPVIVSNLALNKSITGTGTSDGTNIVDSLVNGDPDSRWSVSGFPQSATVDLGATYSISSTEVICYRDRAYQYIIEGSTNGSSYSTIVDRSNNSTSGTNTSPITDSFSASARYIRITVSSANSYTGTWVSLEELRVFGDATSLVSAKGNLIKESFNTSKKEVSIWPNPAKDIVNVSGGQDFHTVAIFDQLGNLIIKQVFKEKSVNVSNLKSGMYILTLIGDTKIINKRIVKK